MKLLTSNLNMKSSVNKKTVKCMAQKKLNTIEVMLHLGGSMYLLDLYAKVFQFTLWVG